MSNIRNLLLFAIALSFFSMGNKAMAQYDLGFNSMRLVPQSNLLNPSYIPNYKYHFGFPGLSSTYGGYGTSGARYNQIFTPVGDSMSIDQESILSSIKKSNNINSRSTNQWLSGGMKWKKFYFSAAISDIADVNALYSKSLVSLAIEGNANHIDETIDASPLALKALQYREYALGAAYQFDDQWNFGIKAKLLFGKSGINSEKSDLSLTTTKDYYYLDVKTDILLNTSLPANKKDTGDVSWSEYAFYGSNYGLGIDLGASYKLDDVWSFSASVLDLGFISYDRWLKSYSSETEFTYKGIDLNQFDGLSDSEREQLIQDTKDSILDLFQIKESVSKFKVPLTAKIYLGASYNLSDIETVSALVRMEIFKGVLRPSFTASYYRQLNENFGVTANYSIINRSYLNLGVGVVANFEPLQVYFVTDNLYGVIFPEKVRYTNFHFGINFIFPSHSVSRPMINL
jgi:hypothetical protein